MKLYNLITERERYASKASQIRNVYIKDLTVEELSQLGDILDFNIANDDEEPSSIRALKELFERQKVEVI
jgi:hypothetical protein